MLKDRTQDRDPDNFYRFINSCKAFYYYVSPIVKLELYNRIYKVL